MAIHDNAPALVVHSRAGVVPGHEGHGVMLGHASGFTWDEALMIAVPLVLIAALLVLARKRVRKK